VTGIDGNFLRSFFVALAELPLEPTDRRYVPLYSEPELAEDDPVELLARSIEWTPGNSVQLFSGFRGTGKSTELRRLRTRLRDANYHVVMLDIEDYLNTSAPVDVGDFLMAVAGGLSDQAVSEGLIAAQGVTESFWDRLTSFFSRTHIELAEVSAGAQAPVGGLSIKANLKTDPSFARRLQQQMAGYLGTFVEEVRKFLAELLERIAAESGEKAGVVVLVDSVEHIRGTSANAEDVQASLENLFAAHAEQLFLPGLHAVYTIPPYLRVRYPNLGSLYEPGGVQVLPALKVQEQSDGSPFEPGMRIAERVVSCRGDWEQLLGNRNNLERIIFCSGGHLRDLLRILAEIVRRAGQLPVGEEIIERAIEQIRSESLPIPDSDARWLARIVETHEASLESIGNLATFARFLDTHVVLCYRNGTEWYDVHPLIREEVVRQAARLSADRP
jgi:hypothetical protein